MGARADSAVRPPVNSRWAGSASLGALSARAVSPGRGEPTCTRVVRSSVGVLSRRGSRPRSAFRLGPAVVVMDTRRSVDRMRVLPTMIAVSPVVVSTCTTPTWRTEHPAGRPRGCVIGMVTPATMRSVSRSTDTTLSSDSKRTSVPATASSRGRRTEIRWPPQGARVSSPPRRCSVRSAGLGWLRCQVRRSRGPQPDNAVSVIRTRTASVAGDSSMTPARSWSIGTVRRIVNSDRKLAGHDASAAGSWM